MRYDNYCISTVSAALLFQEPEDSDACLRIQCSGRFIAEKQSRIFRDRAGDRHSLLFPAGELGRILVFMLNEAHCFQSPVRIQGIFYNLLYQLHIFQNREGRQNIVKLENKPDILRPEITQPVLIEAGNVAAVDHDTA